jgi:hypothetical protein
MCWEELTANPLGSLLGLGACLLAARTLFGAGAGSVWAWETLGGLPALFVAGAGLLPGSRGRSVLPATTKR